MILRADAISWFITPADEVVRTELDTFFPVSTNDSADISPDKKDFA
jgi:hypothetical protein